MKNPPLHLLARTSAHVFTSPDSECRQRVGRSFNLLLTTTHPESAEAWAGEVVHVPVECAEGAIILDLAEVTRIDSCGLSLLLEAMQRISALGGCLFLIRLNEQVRRVLATARLDQVFHIASTRGHALAQYSQQLAA